VQLNLSLFHPNPEAAITKSNTTKNGEPWAANVPPQSGRLLLRGALHRSQSTGRHLPRRKKAASAAVSGLAGSLDPVGLPTRLHGSHLPLRPCAGRPLGHGGSAQHRGDCESRWAGGAVLGTVGAEGSASWAFPVVEGWGGVYDYVLLMKAFPCHLFILSLSTLESSMLATCD
jgi:hypothetical protein